MKNHQPPSNNYSTSMLFPSKTLAPKKQLHPTSYSSLHQSNQSFITSNMCNPAAHKKTILPLPSFSVAPPPVLIGFLREPYSKGKIFLLIFLASILLGTIAFTSLYTFHRGFQRTVQFWRGMAPLVAKYKFVKFKATKIDRCSPEELE